MATAPFWHIEFPRKSDAVLEIENRLSLIEEKKSREITDLRQQYNDGLISAEHFIICNDQMQNEFSFMQGQHDTLIEARENAGRIIVWKNWRAFLLGFGVRFPYFLFSLIISLLILDRVNNKQKDSKTLTQAFFFLQVCCWSITTYLMIWVFWNSQDFPLDAYRYMFIASSLLIGTSLVYFINNYRFSFNNLKDKSIIRFLTNLIFVQAVEKDLVKNVEEWDSEISDPALRKINE